MQGTVASFDARTRSGQVFLDDGTRLDFDAAAFDLGGLRLLRFGQRVNLAVRDGRVVALTLSTFPLPQPPEAAEAPERPEATEFPEVEETPEAR